MAYILSILITFSLFSFAKESSGDMVDYNSFRKQVNESLTREGGWLSVVGLHWLKEGKNTLGSHFKNDLRLPKRGESELGFIQKTGDKYTLHLENPKMVKINGETNSKKVIPLDTDATGKPTSIEHKGIDFYLITRKNGTGLRVKDPEAEARKKFKGRRWMDINPELAIKGHWVAYRAPKKIIIPDVLGNMNEDMVSGHIEFKYKGKKHKLFGTGNTDSLFIVFKDATSGKTTYGSARFLYTSVEKDGSVMVDFNKAYNPPCAFTDYATCPKAPEENILPFEVSAGELPPQKGA